MVEFRIIDKPILKPLIDSRILHLWPFIEVNSGLTLAYFTGALFKKEFFENDITPLLAGDIMSFCNFKYIDKEINEVWGKIDKKSRIEKHLNRLQRKYQ